MCRGSTVLFSGAVLVFGAALGVHVLYSQGMATGTAKARPGRPLPKGLTAPEAHYVDLAAEAGLVGLNVSGSESANQYIVETTGNGVAIFDFDNDGLPDIFFPNADRFGEGPPLRHYLYRNLGGLKFEDVTERSGIRHSGWAQGVCAGDIDGDGHIDLFIPHWGHNVLYRNKGDGTFEEVSQPRGVRADEKRWSTGCAFLDYDRDGHLDLFVANYAGFDPAKTPKPGEKAQCLWKGLPVVCGPRGLPGETMTLYRNKGGGFFEDISDEAGVTGPRNYYGFTVLTGDYDNDGWVDVYVACDSTPSLLYRNNGDGTFEEVGVFSGAAYNEDGREQAGMGASTADYNRNGFLDIVKTNFSDDTPTLYKNIGDGTFMDVTVAGGLAVHTKYLGWGVAFLDFDHDGWRDILMANGHVYPEVDQAGINERYKQERLLYWNRRDGEFFDLSANGGPGITTPRASRGLAVADLDGDGSLEIVIVNLRDRPSLLKNTAPVGNAVTIRALTATGVDAIGARVTVSADGDQIDEVRSGGYHISHGDFRLHFGLGSHEGVKVTVRWPDGTSEQAGAAPANHHLTVQQGKGIIGKKPFERRKPVS